MARVFFQTTENALNSITEQFKLVHPLRTSMLYTRKVAQEIASDNPSVDNEYFKNLMDPENKVHGTDFRTAFLCTAWDIQEEQLAWLLLNNLFAIHEGWAETLFLERFDGKGYKKDTFVESLKKTELSAKFTSYYVTSSKRSKMLTDAFFNVYKDASNLTFSKLDNYMLMYRFFKVARNCFMHANCIASQHLLDAYTAYSTVATATDLDVNEVPTITPPVVGQKIHLNIRGVIGFSDFIQRILIISDINLLQTIAAEGEFISRKPSRPTLTLSSNPNRAKHQIGQLCMNAGFLRPVWSVDLQNHMVTHGFIRKAF